MRLCPACLALIIPLAFTSCRQAKIAYYQVPKEAPPQLPPGLAAIPPGGGADMASTAVPTAQGADLQWTAPAGWTVKPPSPMRHGSYAVSGPDGDADMSVTAFPGDVGGELANINRWREQIQLPPLTQDQLAGATTTLDSHGLHFIIVSLSGDSAPGATAILGAMTATQGNTWFFKLMGPAATVAAAEPAFMQLLHSVTTR